MSDYNEEGFGDNITFDLILHRLPPRLRSKILSPPLDTIDQIQNQYDVIKSLISRKFNDSQINDILLRYPIGKEISDKNQDFLEEIQKIRNSKTGESEISRNFSILNQNYKYCSSWGQWLTWSESVWKIDEKQSIIQAISETLREMKIPSIRQSANLIKGVEFVSRSNTNLVTISDSWDKNPWILATPNGIVDLKTGKSRLSYQDDIVTKITSIHPRKMEIPIWLKFLSDISCNNQDYIDYLQRISGYFLTGSTKEESLFFLYGDGGNGKGVFINTISNILGDYSITAPMGMFVDNKFEGHPTELALLRGARLVSAQETAEGKTWNETRIKALTGSDSVSARFMHKDFFTFTPTFKLLFAGNNEPKLITVDNAIKRRFNKLPFNFKPEKPDLELKENLTKEYPGILLWMIQGCLKWQEIGLATPEIITSATEEYFDDQNNIMQWIQEECDVNLKHDIITTLAFQAWCLWASKNHMKQGTDKTFKNQLERNGFKYNKNTPIRNSDNIALKKPDNKTPLYARGFVGFKLRKQIRGPVSK